MKTFIALSIVVFLVACSATKFATATQADADRMQVKFPGVTTTQLMQGKMHYEQNCNRCHPYKKPGSRTEAQWRNVLPRMVVKAEQKTGKEITPEQEEAMLRYLVTFAKPK